MVGIILQAYLTGRIYGIGHKRVLICIIACLHQWYSWAYQNHFSTRKNYFTTNQPIVDAKPRNLPRCYSRTYCSLKLLALQWYQFWSLLRYLKIASPVLILAARPHLWYLGWCSPVRSEFINHYWHAFLYGRIQNVEF